MRRRSLRLLATPRSDATPYLRRRSLPARDAWARRKWAGFRWRPERRCVRCFRRRRKIADPYFELIPSLFLLHGRDPPTHSAKLPEQTSLPPQIIEPARGRSFFPNFAIADSVAQLTRKPNQRPRVATAAAETSHDRALLLRATQRLAPARVRQLLREHPEDSSSAAGETRVCR